MSWFYGFGKTNEIRDVNQTMTAIILRNWASFVKKQ